MFFHIIWPPSSMPAHGLYLVVIIIIYACYATQGLEIFAIDITIQLPVFFEKMIDCKC